MKTISILLALLLSGHLFAQSNGTTLTASKPAVELLANGMTRITHYHPNGNIAETGFFLNGQKHGTWQVFDELGNKSMEGNWKNGVKDGNWTTWHNNGTLHFLLVYESGKRVIATQWDPNGSLIAGNQSR